MPDELKADYTDPGVLHILGWKDTVRIVSLNWLLENYDDGDERGWDEEFAWLIENSSQRLMALQLSIRTEGIRVPILLGNDGRVWDGHHRLCAANAEGFDRVPVEFA